MSQYLTLLKRELKSITREKTIVFAIMVQFFIASFSSILLTGIMAFYDPTSISDTSHVSIRVGLVGDSRMAQYLGEKGITVRSFPDLPAAEHAFQTGRIDTVMFIPESNSGVVEMKLIVPKLDTRKTVILMMIDEPLKKYEDYLREASGVTLNYRDIGGKPSATYEFLYSVIIPILMLFPALIAGSIMIDTVSEEFENKTFDTLMAAPVSLKQVFAAKVSAAVITAVLQTVMWTLLLRLNGFTIRSGAPVLLLAMIVAALVTFSAAIIAMYFKDRERAQFVYSIVLIVLVGFSYFINASPTSLITRLASGAPGAGAFDVALYAMLLLATGTVFFRVSRRLVLTRP